MMDTVPESDHSRSVTTRVKPVGLRKGVRIPVGGTVQHSHIGPGGYGEIAQLDVLDSHPWHAFNHYRRGVSKHFGYECRGLRRGAGEPASHFWVIEHRQHSVIHGGRGGLETAKPEAPQHEHEFGFAEPRSEFVFWTKLSHENRNQVFFWIALTFCYQRGKVLFDLFGGTISQLQGRVIRNRIQRYDGLMDSCCKILAIALWHSDHVWHRGDGKRFGEFAVQVDRFAIVKVGGDGFDKYPAI